MRQTRQNEIVRFLYHSDLHGDYKKSANFRFFYVVPLHRQTKTTAKKLRPHGGKFTAPRETRFLS